MILNISSENEQLQHLIRQQILTNENKRKQAFANRINFKSQCTFVLLK